MGYAIYVTAPLQAKKMYGNATALAVFSINIITKLNVTEYNFILTRLHLNKYAIFMFMFD